MFQWDSEKFGKEFQKVRDHQGFSLQEVSDELGISPATIKRAEEGGNVYTYITMALASWAELSVSRYIQEDDKIT